MYFIVEFEISNEVEIIPKEWIADGTKPQDAIDGSVKLVQFYWPPYLASKIANSVKNRIPAEVTWPVFNTRILGYAGKKLPKNC